MRIMLAVAFTVLILALPATAQTAPGSNPPARRGRQPGPDGQAGVALGPMAQRLAEQLNLTPAQRELFDALVAKYQAQAEQSRGDRAELRELARQFRAARQSGDDARANELRSQMEERRAGRTQILDAFVQELRPVLDEAQTKTLDQVQQRMRQGAAAGQQVAQVRNLVQRLPEELQLTEEQRAQFDTLVAEQRKQLQSQRATSDERRPLMKELQDARTAGDEERAAQLQAQLDQSRPTAPDFKDFFAKLEPILTAEQKAKLETLRSKNAAPGGPVDVRAVLRAAKQLDLTEQQQERLKAIVREAQTAESKGPADVQTRGELAQRAKTQIVEMLDAKQVAEFERLLQRSERPDRRAQPARGDGGAGQPNRSTGAGTNNGRS